MEKTKRDIQQVFMELKDGDWATLYLIAARYTRADSVDEPGDLVHEVVVRIEAGRRTWSGDTHSLMAVLSQMIRSVASEMRKKAGGTVSFDATVDDGEAEHPVVPEPEGDRTLQPESVHAQRRHKEQTERIVSVLARTDFEAAVVRAICLDGLLKPGEVASALGVEPKSVYDVFEALKKRCGVTTKKGYAALDAPLNLTSIVDEMIGESSAPIADTIDERPQSEGDR